MDKTSVLLADDHAALREGVAMLVNREHDMAVIGEAGDGREAVQLAQQLQPDVAVLDLSMPRLSGIEAAAQMREACPLVQVLVLTRHGDQAHLKRMLECGAKGYVLKRSTSDALVGAIRTVAKGRTHIDSGLVDALFDETLGSRKKARDCALTTRETQVLTLVAWGYTNKEVAARLDLSVKTVEFYKACATEKLQLSSRSEILRYALARGWVSESESPD